MGIVRLHSHDRDIVFNPQLLPAVFNNLVFVCVYFWHSFVPDLINWQNWTLHEHSFSLFLSANRFFLLHLQLWCSITHHLRTTYRNRKLSLLSMTVRLWRAQISCVCLQWSRWWQLHLHPGLPTVSSRSLNTAICAEENFCQAPFSRSWNGWSRGHTHLPPPGWSRMNPAADLPPCFIF